MNDTLTKVLRLACYGRALCTAIRDAGGGNDPRLLPGLKDLARVLGPLEARDEEGVLTCLEPSIALLEELARDYGADLEACRQAGEVELQATLAEEDAPDDSLEAQARHAERQLMEQDALDNPDPIAERQPTYYEINLAWPLIVGGAPEVYDVAGDKFGGFHLGRAVLPGWGEVTILISINKDQTTDHCGVGSVFAIIPDERLTQALQSRRLPDTPNPDPKAEQAIQNLYLAENDAIAKAIFAKQIAEHLEAACNEGQAGAPKNLGDKLPFAFMPGHKSKVVN